MNVLRLHDIRDRLPGWEEISPNAEDSTFDYLEPWTASAISTVGLSVASLTAEAARSIASNERRSLADAWSLVRECALLIGSNGRPHMGNPRYFLSPVWEETLLKARQFLNEGQIVSGQSLLARVLGWCLHYQRFLFGLDVPDGWVPLMPSAASVYDEELASNYERLRPVSSEWRQGVDRFAKRWVRGSDVVELGAGTGRVAASVSMHARSYIATEPAMAMVECLAKNLESCSSQDAGSNVSYAVADALNLPLGDACVDVVFEHEALFMVPEPLLAVREASRVLRGGGAFIRLVIRTVPSDHTRRADWLSRSFRMGVLSGAPAFLIRGKGSDARVDRFLRDNRIEIDSYVLARWTEERSVRELLDVLSSKAFPYLSSVHPIDLSRGERCAREFIRREGMDVNGTLRLERELVAVVSKKE